MTELTNETKNVTEVALRISDPVVSIGGKLAHERMCGY